MTWEACKNYGLIMIEPNGNEVRLYYNMLSSQFAGTPAGFYADSALWQGNFLQVHGRDSHGTKRIILMDGFYSWRYAY
ncbi:MAG: hypothetical protein O3C32_00770 [Bacteroidetes bacterium]|nr:hypothetical protein [Bacteroidota bacterium]